MTHGVVSLRRPRVPELGALLEHQAGLPFSYKQTGMTSDDRPPAGFLADVAEVVVGQGGDVFDNAVSHLQNWRVHERSGLQVRAEGPAQVDAAVVLVAHWAVAFVTLACRVVYVVEGERRWGFAYGTLEHHPETGEELFLVHHGLDDKVRFRVRAYSRHGHWLTWAIGPTARLIQHRATLNYLEAMKDLVS